jgi:hypothetical protein
MVALDKELLVQSVNGPSVTRILGQMSAQATGRRCAWLTNGATLCGFTLRWGGTRNTGDPATLTSGGGVWCSSATAIVTNCYIMSCQAASQGGGAYGGTLKNCWIWSNYALSGGGGAYGSILNNCTLMNNYISGVNGGATRSCVLTNCTLSYNFAYNTFGTAGSSSDQLYNCIVYFNSTGGTQKNYDSSSSTEVLLLNSTATWYWQYQQRSHLSVGWDSPHEQLALLGQRKHSLCQRAGY